MPLQKFTVAKTRHSDATQNRLKRKSLLQHDEIQTINQQDYASQYGRHMPSNVLTSFPTFTNPLKGPDPVTCICDLSTS